jgi:dihydroflavonol-4-reductase
VARALLARGRRVRVLARSNSDRRNLGGLAVEIAEGAMEDPRSLARAVAGCRYVYHVAADYRIWVPDPAPMFRANVEGTRDLLTAALEAGAERVVYTSSVATLGLVPGGSATEETPSSVDDMIGPYKRSKFAAEQVARGLARERGLPVVIVNPSTPVGPGDIKPTPTGRLIVETARGQMPAFVDTGLNIVHVDDVAEGHLAAAENGRIGERYILGGENMALAEILAEVAQAVGRRPPWLRVPHSVLFPVAIGAELAARATGRDPFVTLDGVRMSRKKMYFSSEKASRELGYRSRPAREAIADAVCWFRDNGYLQ